MSRGREGQHCGGARVKDIDVHSTPHSPPWATLVSSAVYDQNSGDILDSHPVGESLRPAVGPCKIGGKGRWPEAP